MTDGGTLLGLLILAACFICWLGCRASERRTKRNEEDGAKVIAGKLPPGAASEPEAVRAARFGGGR